MSTPSYLSMADLADSTSSYSTRPEADMKSSLTSKSVKSLMTPNPSNIDRAPASPNPAGNPLNAILPVDTTCSIFLFNAASIADVHSNQRSLPEASLPSYLCFACLRLFKYSTARFTAFVFPLSLQNAMSSLNAGFS
eukprot:CAMPEP_0185767268 /NCGR_PEP_ID=MMETSP1174-20130828/41859_1 /TAXON_ID=35687 /ORGANISM="Dictyocha speculum, Strain CCMP1381" /LENGTH=136 /DNA_ID=CAMNT_0028451355 /DNA_START=344 /DNA_END=754 /DNA_ORIENTATION=+